MDFMWIIPFFFTGFITVVKNYRIVVFFPACFCAILLNEMGIPKPMRFAKSRKIKTGYEKY